MYIRGPVGAGPSSQGVIMDLEGLKLHCLDLKGTTMDFPFDESTLVYRVGGKMYCLTDISEARARVNLKCDPLIAHDLREEFEDVIPGYHMNKVHWNTVSLDGGVPEERIRWMIDHSYALVLASLSKRDREALLHDLSV